MREGTILSIRSEHCHRGKSSVGYDVTVRRGKASEGEPIFSTRVTFVNVDEAGAKVEIVE